MVPHCTTMYLLGNVLWLCIYLLYDAIFILHLQGFGEVRVIEEQCYKCFVSPYIWQELRIGYHEDIDEYS